MSHPASSLGRIGAKVMLQARHLILSLLLVAAIAATSLWMVHAPPKPGVSLSNFAYIHHGMSLEEILGVMGRRPDHSHGNELGSTLRWNCDSGTVVVTVIQGVARLGHFERDGNVVAMLPEPPESFRARIARWIGFGKGSF